MTGIPHGHDPHGPGSGLGSVSLRTLPAGIGPPDAATAEAVVDARRVLAAVSAAGEALSPEEAAARTPPPRTPGQQRYRSTEERSAKRREGYQHKRALERSLGGKVAAIPDPASRLVTQDAQRLFGELLADLPSDGPLVRQVATLLVRHLSHSAYWAQQAVLAGLGSVRGMKATTEATRHGQRAERLAIAVLEISSRYAKGPGTGSGGTRKPVLDLDAINRAAKAQTDARRAGRPVPGAPYSAASEAEEVDD